MESALYNSRWDHSDVTTAALIAGTESMAATSGSRLRGFQSPVAFTDSPAKVTPSLLSEEGA